MIRAQRRSAFSPYRLFCVEAKDEIIGAWLKENTITGTASHSECHRSGLLNWVLARPLTKFAVCQVGTRYSEIPIKNTSSGNTNMPIAETIASLPRSNTRFRPPTTARLSQPRGSGAR